MKWLEELKKIRRAAYKEGHDAGIYPEGKEGAIFFGSWGAAYPQIIALLDTYEKVAEGTKAWSDAHAHRLAHPT
ncbi:hypothetical protein LCGC14_1059510, partial [marine sediment metagenome]